MASNGSKIVNKPKPAAQKKPQPEKLKVVSDDERMANTVSQTVTKTMEQLLPLLQKNSTDGQSARRTLHRGREEVVHEINNLYDKRIKENNAFLRKLASAPEKDFRQISIPRVFRKYFGPRMPVSINTSTISIPIDGRKYKVHKAFVPIIRQKLNYEDEKIAFMEASDFDDTSFVQQGDLNN